jgi:DNA-directed RNA polymerase subunit RPC12/RpoP
MPKAILELEMPESCTECMFKECLNRTTSVEVSRCIILHKMHVPGSYCPAEGRQADCPLKLVERCEWILIDDDKGLWQCSKCGAEWVLEAGTPADNEMNYCPACGRRLSWGSKVPEI